MRRFAYLGVLVAVVITAIVYSSSQTPDTATSKDIVSSFTARDAKPWTDLPLINQSEVFRFAIVSDRCGGHRPEIFAKAINHINLMQPEFVLSVGDLIEGYTDKKAELEKMWSEFGSFVGKLQMPFFHVAGNHDVSNTSMRDHWKQKFGRTYYHFLYKNVLFLCMDTEDFPEGGKGTAFSKEQFAYFDQVLKANTGVRWTFIALHKPVWAFENAQELGWNTFEQSLKDRPYTVFAGHEHHYRKFVRQGRNYYQLATTGGGSKLRGLPYGEFDQIAWVTMKKEPVLANIALDGILPEDMNPVQPIGTEPGVSTKDRLDTHPVTGKLYMDGQPLSNVQVVFYLVVPEELKSKYKNANTARLADGVTDADGRFTLSTYKAEDGAPQGTYLVAITKAPALPDGSDRPAKVYPKKYTRHETAGIKAVVNRGSNDLRLEISYEE